MRSAKLGHIFVRAMCNDTFYTKKRNLDVWESVYISDTFWIGSSCFYCTAGGSENIHVDWEDPDAPMLLEP